MGKYELRGILYPNNPKSKPSQPDHIGKATIAGIDYRIAAWDNGDYMNMQFTILEEDGVKAKKPKKPTGTEHTAQDTGAPPWDDDDDIPF